jgi:Ran GTPase-activating protein (RanGAP) involved in mRNA processing and transport
MRALSSVNLLQNSIGIRQAQALASILKAHPTLKSLCGNIGDETELDMRGKMKGAADAIMLVPEIIDNGAILKLDISNCLLRTQGTKFLAEALKGNQVMTELNISSNQVYWDDKSGVIAVTDAISDMGTLTKFDISKTEIRAEGGKLLAAGLKGNQGIIELNIADNQLGWDANVDADMSGIIALADVIPGMGALSVTNVMGNWIGKEQLAKLQEIMRSKPNLVSLCGIADDATEADLSSLGMDADDAAILASELPDKGALTTLDFSRNSIPSKQEEEIERICAASGIELAI